MPSEKSTAASACSAVVSKRGYVQVALRAGQRELGAGEDDALGAGGDLALDDGGQALARAIVDVSLAELVEDHPVHFGTLGRIGDRALDAASRQMPDVERLLHRVAGAEQRHASAPRSANHGGRRIGDVQQRDRERRLDRVGDAMHRVRADQDALGAGVFEAACRIGQQRRQLRPGSRLLAHNDLLEVEAAQLQLGRSFSLAFARINLLAALLAGGDAARARPVAQAAWSRAAAFDLQHAAAAYLALLCALEGRHRAAVKLAAYSEAIYAARGEVRERNETAATTRAQALAREALGETAFARLHAEGEALRDAAAGELAFAAGDTA